MTLARALFVVPARGGSKGLPRKNARVLGDLPLLGWTAEAVRRAGIGGATAILSTDDEEIAAIGRQVGLEVPFLRPPALAEDATSAEAVARHALDWYGSAMGALPEALFWLQPTSPFRNPDSLGQAMAMLQADASLDGVLGVKAIYRTPATLFLADGQGVLAPLSDSEPATRRQEVRPLLTPCGALYAVRTAAFLDQQTLFPRRTRALLMDLVASIDIDDPTDWQIAEAVARGGLSWRGVLPAAG